MATVGITNPATYWSAIAGTPASSSSSTNGSSQTNQNGSDALANESTFLQLLVAQLKNQNPDQPMDGTTFVTQLAQFSDLEQNLAMRQDLDSISAKYLNTGTATNSSTDSSQNSTADQTGAANPTS